MATIGSMVVKLIADAQQFEQQMAVSSKTLRGMERQFQRSARNLERIGQSMMLGITAPMSLIGGSALNMAMEAEEASNLFRVTMGDMADKAEAFSQQLRDQFGLATDAVNQQQAAFYRHFKVYGLVGEQALQMAQNLTVLTNDLSSFVNLDPSEVLERLQSGLRGETDAVERLGITLADSIVRQTAYRHGIAEQGAQLSETQKQLARYLAIMEQTADAQGDLARTLESPANQLRITRQQLSEANKNLGRGLLPFLQASIPVLRQLTGALNNAAIAFQQVNPVMQQTIVWAGVLLMAAGPVTYALGMLSSAAGMVVGGLNGIVKFGRRAAGEIAKLRASTASFGSVMVAIAGGKIKLILAGIAALAAASLLLILNWDRVSAAASRVWGGISAVVLYAASLIVRGVSLIVGALAWLIPALRPAADSVRGWADSLKSAAQTALSASRSAATVQQVGNAAQQTAASANQAAQAQQNLGESMENAAAKAGDNLQSFDQVHQIQEQMAASPAASAPELGDMTLTGIELPGVGAITDLASGIQEQMASVGESVSGVWERIGQAWDNLLQKCPPLQAAINGINTAMDWIRANWPTIGPIVENIASIVMLSLVPALIKSGVEAAIAGATHVAAWVQSGLAAVGHGAKIVGQLALIGAKWAWAGLQAAVHGAKIVAAWAAQGWEAVASGAKQVGQFVLLVGRWIALGAQATVEGAKVAAAWVTQKVQAIGSAAAQIPQFVALIGRWIALGVQATVEAAKVAAAWLAQKVQAIASVAAQVGQIVLLVGKWIWMGAQSLLAAGQMAAAWVMAMGPIPLVIAAVVGLAVLVIAKWDELKAWTINTWTAITAWLSTTWETLKQTALTVWTTIWSTISGWWESVRTTTEEVWTAVTGWLGETWDGIVTTVSNVWTTLWDTVSSWWDSIKTNTEETWNGICGTLSGIWNTIKSTADNVWKGIANTVIRFVNGIIEAINQMIRALNRIKINIPDWVPGLGGKSFGFNLKTISTIPYLASGGNIVGAGMAVVGEAGAELVELPRGARVTPLSGSGDSDLVEAVGQAVYAAVRQALQSSSRGNGREEIILQIDGQRFARLILPAIEREGQRIGSPIVRLQGV